LTHTVARKISEKFCYLDRDIEFQFLTRWYTSAWAIPSTDVSRLDTLSEKRAISSTERTEFLR